MDKDEESPLTSYDEERAVQESSSQSDQEAGKQRRTDDEDYEPNRKRKRPTNPRPANIRLKQTKSTDSKKLKMPSE